MSTSMFWTMDMRRKDGNIITEEELNDIVEDVLCWDMDDWYGCDYGCNKVIDVEYRIQFSTCSNFAYDDIISEALKLSKEYPNYIFQIDVAIEGEDWLRNNITNGQREELLGEIKYEQPITIIY